MNYTLELEVEDVDAVVQQIFRLARICRFKVAKIEATPSVNDRTYSISLQIERLANATALTTCIVENLESLDTLPGAKSSYAPSMERSYHGIRMVTTTKKSCSAKPTVLLNPREALACEE